jgi:hypothetical protein
MDAVCSRVEARVVGRERESCHRKDFIPVLKVLDTASTRDMNALTARLLIYVV